MGRPQPLKRLIKIKIIIENKEIAIKTSDFTRLAELNIFFILEILLKMPPSLFIKQYLRVIQYTY